MRDVIDIINTNESFVLAGHTGPDGDCIGSCYGLAYVLEAMGKKVAVLLEPYPHKYNVLPGRKFLYTGDIDALDFDVLICLDCADSARLGFVQPLLAKAHTSVCIDHHATNVGFADVNYIEANTASTSEIVYRLAEQLVPITRDIATAIYTGIVCDTGGFKYNATTKTTMEIAGKLLDTGINFTDIYSEVLHKHSFAAAKAKGIALANMKRTKCKKIVYSHITNAELTKIDASSHELDGIVEYLLNTNNALCSFFVYEKKDSNGNLIAKISLRSIAPDVGSIAAKLGGGGHKLAAGANYGTDIAKAVDDALKLIMQEILV